MADRIQRPIEVHHATPAFSSSRTPIVSVVELPDKEVHIASVPTDGKLHNIVSIHYNTPDGRPVHERFPPMAT